MFHTHSRRGAQTKCSDGREVLELVQDGVPGQCDAYCTEENQETVTAVERLHGAGCEESTIHCYAISHV